jgi:cytochrome c-type biogenesis protein CcmF
MEEIQYLGEHLIPGVIGRIAIALGFVSALIASVAYFLSIRSTQSDEWKQIGRFGFTMHSFSILTVIAVIFYIMIQRYYEYQYVWAHVSDDLPLKYIASAFWEGQEGSFLLWMFWNIILAAILVFKKNKWEAPVVATILVIQWMINSMLLGIYLTPDFKLGSNPLLLLRDTMDAPVFNNADYLSLIRGNGLNPLLQNYWMTIHPPTLFLGFASTAMPFGFAIGGLITGNHKEWLKPVLPWALFSGSILGIGILMGGAWAYEALTFGGYWAWDPVENMSLVPWLILVAGIHTNLISRATGYSIRSTYFLYLLTFILIVYSTFLTRSGVLGETSVHAFTEMGLEGQLLLFLGMVAIIPLVIFFIQYKHIEAPEKEEASYSREFWMFIGSLVLIFSAALITISTSLPVYNKIRQLFEPGFVGEVITDPIPHYNKYQIWIAIFISLLSGIALFLRYREKEFKHRLKSIALYLSISLISAGVLTYLTSLWIDTFFWQYGLLLFTSIFALTTNLIYWGWVLRFKLKTAASVFSHIGFGLMIIGVIASGLNQRIITSNSFLMDGLIEGDEKALRNNVLLFKNNPIQIKDYEVTYTRDTLDVFTRTYFIEFKKMDSEEQFTLSPNILYEKDFTKIAAYNPSTRRYLDRDIFSSITALPQVEMDINFKKDKEAELKYKVHHLLLNTPFTFTDTTYLEDLDSFQLKQFTVFIKGIDRSPVHPDYHYEEGDVPIGLDMEIRKEDGTGKIYQAKPLIVIRGQLVYGFPVQINDINVKIKLPENVLDLVFESEDELRYQEFVLVPGQKINFSGHNIEFKGFNKSPKHTYYQAADGDVAASSVLEIDQQYTVSPVFLIRDGQSFNIKEQLDEIGLHIRLTKIDPEKGAAILSIAKSAISDRKYPVEIATDSLRYDYIVLEAKVFPGINLFWLGATMMMLGLGLGIWPKWRNRG